MKRKILSTAGTAEKSSAPPNTTAAGVASADAGQFIIVSPSQAVAANDARPIVPEFCRLPRPGYLCPWTGLSRSTLNALILPCPANNFRPLVKSISLRKKGTARGCRLIVYASLISYLNNQTNEADEHE